MSTSPAPVIADHEFSPNSTLTPQQHRIITGLAAGHSITEAAAQEGLHRNTVGYWRRTQPNFARELEFAVREQRLYWHEQAIQLAPQAIATLEELLTNPDTSPSLRFRAAALILKMATGDQANLKPERTTAVPELEAISGQVHALRKGLLATEFVQSPQNSEAAQTCTKPQPIRVPPQPGRNAVCPCGSGLKFKRCCIAGLAPKAA